MDYSLVHLGNWRELWRALEPQAPAPVLSFCSPCTDDTLFKKNIRSLDDVLKINYKMKINKEKKRSYGLFQRSWKYEY